MCFFFFLVTEGSHYVSLLACKLKYAILYQQLYKQVQFKLESEKTNDKTTPTTSHLTQMHTKQARQQGCGNNGIGKTVVTTTYKLWFPQNS